MKGNLVGVNLLAIFLSRYCTWMQIFSLPAYILNVIAPCLAVHVQNNYKRIIFFSWISLPRSPLKNGGIPRSRRSDNSTNEKWRAVAHWQNNTSPITLQPRDTDEHRPYHSVSIRGGVVFSRNANNSSTPTASRRRKPANKSSRVAYIFVLEKQEMRRASATIFIIRRAHSLWNLRRGQRPISHTSAGEVLNVAGLPFIRRVMVCEVVPIQSIIKSAALWIFLYMMCCQYVATIMTQGHTRQFISLLNLDDGDLTLSAKEMAVPFQPRKIRNEKISRDLSRSLNFR